MIGRSLRSGRFERLSGILLKVGCERRSPRLVAAAWMLATAPIGIQGEAPPRLFRRSSRLVVLHKLGGTDDVIAASLAAGDARSLVVATLPRLHVRAVFRALVGPKFPTLRDLDYRAGDREVEEDKLRYRAFLREVLRHYIRWGRIAAMVTPNVSFRAERELAAASSEVGLPFIVLHKESIRTEAQRPWFTRAYAERIGPFAGSGIAVYNADEQRSLVASGMATPGDVAVVGCPRMDVLHAIRGRTPHPGSTLDAPVVMFSIDVQAGTWTPYDGQVEVGSPRWERCAELAEHGFLTAALRHPERPFVAKVKIGRESQQLARIPADLPPNLSVVSGGIGTDLLARAAVVIALNSTVLLEAIAAGVPTIVPRFGEASAPEAERWLFELRDAVVTVREEDGLPDAIDEALVRGPSAVLSAAAVEVLERYVGNSDGRAGLRAWEFFLSRISGRR